MSQFTDARFGKMLPATWWEPSHSDGDPDQVVEAPTID
jgi:hypothetical protein